MKIGYARVPTADESTAMQLDALRSAGCERIFEDVASGAKASRPGLDKAMAFACKGDEFVVCKLDRFGHSLSHLVQLMGQLHERGIGFRSITERIETHTSAGHLVVRLFAALAEFERDLINEKTRNSRPAARARGRAGGRKPLSEAKQEKLAQMWVKQAMTASEIAEKLQISRRTVFKYVKALPETNISKQATKP